MFPVIINGTKSPPEITWTVQGAFDIRCAMIMTWFPYDEHDCYFELSTTMSPSTVVFLQPSEQVCLDMSHYHSNNEFAVQPGSCKISVRKMLLVFYA